MLTHVASVSCLAFGLARASPLTLVSARSSGQ